MDERCFCCGKAMRAGRATTVYCDDDQAPWVGVDCARKVEAAGPAGYQPPQGGPRLWWSKAWTPGHSSAVSRVTPAAPTARCRAAFEGVHHADSNDPSQAAQLALFAQGWTAALAGARAEFEDLLACSYPLYLGQGEDNAWQIRGDVNLDSMARALDFAGALQAMDGEDTSQRLPQTLRCSPPVLNGDLQTALDSVARFIGGAKDRFGRPDPAANNDMRSAREEVRALASRYGVAGGHDTYLDQCTALLRAVSAAIRQ